MLPFGKQQEILDFLFDDKSRRDVGRPPGTLFIEDGVEFDFNEKSAGVYKSNPPGRKTGDAEIAL